MALKLKDSTNEEIKHHCKNLANEDLFQAAMSQAYLKGVLACTEDNCEILTNYIVQSFRIRLALLVGNDAEEE